MMVGIRSSKIMPESGAFRMPKNKLIIAGGSGFLGLNFTKHLAMNAPNQWDVIILSRSQPNCDPKHAQWVQWDGRTLGEWTERLIGATHILNLAGRSIDCRKTPDRWRQIIDSRVDTTNLIGEALRQIDHAPECWVQMSAIGIYGTESNNICTEESEHGADQLAQVVQLWEATFETSCPLSTRAVTLRSGVVLGRDSGAFPVLHRLARFGLGGKAGSGKQGISWIHIHDICRLIENAFNTHRTGVYNACTDDPKSNADFMRALRKAINQPIGLPAPGLGIRILCSIVLDTDASLALKGAYCSPKRLIDEGFEFKFAEIDSAMHDLTSKP